MARKPYLVLCAFGLMSGVLSAQPHGESQENAQPVSFPAFAKELVEHNAEIQAARYRFEAATKRPSQAGTLPDPKLTATNLGVGHPFSGLNGSDFAYQGVGITQELPFPGKLALASEEAKKNAQGEREMYEATIRDVMSRLKIAYFEWASIAKQIEITNKNRDVLQRFEEVARNRYSVGKGLQQDVLKAQVELSQLAQEIELLQQKRSSTEAQVQYLLGREEDIALGQPGEFKRSAVSLDLDALLSLIDENSPRVRAQQFLVGSRAIGLERSRKDYRPDFAVNVQWQHTGPNFPDYYSATAEVKIPLYFRRKQRFATEEAQARLGEARETYRSTRQEAIFLVKDQYLTAVASERLLSLYESGTIPQATLALESTASAYEVGKVDFLTLLSSLASVLALEKQYYAELARHEQALARLEALVGREFTAVSGEGR